MARIRQIKPEFYLDDELAQCSRDARLMFPGLWMLADRAGRLEDRPAKIKAQLFPYDIDITAKTIESCLEQLAEFKFILRYSINDKSYIQIRSFKKHQKCHPREIPSQIPPPPILTESKPDEPEEPGPKKDMPSREKVVPSREKEMSSSAASTSTSTSGVRLLGSGVGCGFSSIGSNSLSGRDRPEKNRTTTLLPLRPAADLVLTNELLEWAENNCPDIDAEAETEKFIDYYGRDGTTFVDLEAGWRTWMRKAIDRQATIRSNETVEEHNRRAAAGAEKLMAARRSVQ